MKILATGLIVCFIAVFFLTMGCSDISSKQQVGAFGTAFGASPEDQQAINWFISTYGDPRTNNDQPPRFVLPMIATALDSNNLPSDDVTTFPQAGGSVFFFVIYDNFKQGDPITVTWTYLDNGKVVSTVNQQAGGDFGRFIVEFQKPDSGWGKGNQEITVSGDGVSGKVDFSIGDSIQTIPLPYSPENSGSPGSTGKLVPGAHPKLTPTINSLSRDLERNIHSASGAGEAAAATTTPVTFTTTPAINTKTDVNNCGQVGYACPTVLHAYSQCVGGTCRYSCDNGWDYNNGHVDNPINPSVGCNLNTNTDSKNCGGFDRVCPGSEVCQNGGCVNTCQAGSSGENVQACTGGCTDIKTDPDNCGFCGHVCPTYPHAHVACIDSQCSTQAGRPLVCDNYWGDCDGDRNNGCEADLTKDGNCGQCGVSCGSQAEQCFGCRGMYTCEYWGTIC